MNFQVINTGKLDLSHITVRCDLEAVQTEAISVGEISVANGPPLVAKVLAPGEQTTTYCPFLENFARNRPIGRTIYARISMATESRLRIIPWKLQRRFRFELREIAGIRPFWTEIPNDLYGTDKP